MAESERGRSEEWPYIAGRRGLNRVRVYDRDDSGCIQIEWVDDTGRVQRSLRTVVGEPVTDRDLARDIADRVAEAQKEKRNAAARREVFGSTGMRLETLLDKLHAKREKGWSESYIRDQKRFKAFWLEKLGKKTPLQKIGGDPNWVEEVAEKEATKREWADRTTGSYLRYLVDAFTFARRKLKVITERYDLSAVDIPSPNSEGVAYTEAEIQKLLPALKGRDPRAYVIGEAYYQAGRRLNATRTLEVDDVRIAKLPTTEGEVQAAILSYPATTDKVGRSSDAVLVGGVVDVIEELAQQPAVRDSGLLMPGGSLDETGATAPIRKGELIDMLHEAEAEAKIEHVEGRAYHGIKRRFSGSSREDRQIAALQAGTSEEMLRDTYDPDDDLPAKAALAKKLDEKRRAKVKEGA